MEQERGLKILTLDGGGLQALSTLSSLNAVCKAIAQQQGTARPPAPHELFDVIAGIGTGGWIALLLGRYRLDVATCTAIYMEIASKLEFEPSTLNQIRKARQFRIDQERLTGIVAETLQRYDLDPALLWAEDSDSTSGDEASQCRHVFAAGVLYFQNREQKMYELFRTYRVDEALQAELLSGPAPQKCSIPDVFAAVAAAKFFSGPYEIGSKVFFDETFPHAHHISAIALDEIFGHYGPNIDISLVLNIGPGIPAEKDIEELDTMSLGAMSRLTRKFSWPIGKHFSARPRFLFLGEDEETAEAEPPSISNISSSELALRLEHQSRVDIRARLREIHGGSGADKYCHLGPDYSEAGASLNDVQAICRARSQTSEVQQQQSMAEAETVARQYWVDAVR